MLSHDSHISHPKVLPEHAMQAFSAAGEHLPADLTAELAKYGFQVGAVVAPKATPTEKHTIKSIGDVVHVEGVSGVTEQIAPQKFLKAFSLYEEVWLPTDMAHRAIEHDQFRRNSARALVSAALHALVAIVDAAPVKIISKPAKKVYADANGKAGAVVFVPESTSVSLSDKIPAGAVVVESSIADTWPGASLFLSPPAMASDPGKPSLVSPFWLVRASADKAECNMEMSTRTVELSMKMKTPPGAATQTTTASVTFPVLRNKRAVHTGDELVYHDEAVAETEGGQGPKRRKIT